MNDKRFVPNGTVNVFQSIVPQVEAGDGTINGVPFDKQDHPDCPQDFLVVASFGALGGGGTLSATVTVEESDTEGSDYTQVTSENVISAQSLVFTGAGKDYLSVRASGVKRFLRAKVASDFTDGTDPSIPLEVLIIGINPRWNPAESN